MATNKVSSKNFELIREEMIRQGIDVSNFKTDILVEDGVISSSTRSSIQFKDKNDNYWRASLTWKSVEKGVEGRNDSEDMKKISRESSSKERLSEEATRDAKKTMKCKLALEKINEVFKGYISGITNFGIFIHLTDLGIEGLCHIKRLPGNEYYLFDENSKSLVGKNSGNSYLLGNTISAKIKSVDITSHRIDLEIIK